MNRAELRALRLRLIDGGALTNEEALTLVDDLVDALAAMPVGPSYRPAATEHIAAHIRSWEYRHEEG